MNNECMTAIHTYLADAGFTLMDHEWRGWSHSYRFLCGRGHESSLQGETLARRVDGHRGQLVCRQCWIDRTMVRIHDIASEAGGVCLTTEYGGLDSHYHFVCAAGHHFETKAITVIDGHWCLKCAATRRAERRRYDGDLKSIKERAREHGGECISTTYNGHTAKYWFRCAQGHEWEAFSSTVMGESWCPECFAERKRMPDGKSGIQQAAYDRGGICLMTRYRGIHHFYSFRCARGHEWTAWGKNVLEGAWCLKCRTEDRQREGLERMRAIADERGGLCVSDAYLDNNTRLEWECGRGHRWWARPRQVASGGSWCPECKHMSQITREKTRRKPRYRTSQRSSIQEAQQQAPPVHAPARDYSKDV